MKRNDKRVVITGIGPVSPVGIGKKDFWEGLCSQNLSINKIDYKVGKKKWVSFYKHEVKNFNINSFGIDNYAMKCLNDWKKYEDVDLLYLLAATKLAIDDAHLKYDRESNKIGLIVTHENPGLEHYFSEILESSFDFLSNNKSDKIKFYNYMFKKMLKNSFELQTFMPLFHIARTFGIHGYSLFINNACASGAYALEEARKAICMNQCNAVVVVGGDCPNVYKYLWFKSLGMHLDDIAMRPFSSKSSGFLMGDGSSGLVLESLDSALKRGAYIYGEYLGGSFSSEAWKVTWPNPSSKQYESTIREAVKVSGLDIKDIDLLVPHGVATSISDKFEAKSISNVFGKELSQLKVTALKPYFGHNLGGNTLLELLATLLMLKKKQILPTLNIEPKEIISDLNMVTESKKLNFSTVLKSTCAFAGFNSAVVIRKCDKNV